MVYDRLKKEVTELFVDQAIYGQYIIYKAHLFAFDGEQWVIVM